MSWSAGARCGNKSISNGNFSACEQTWNKSTTLHWPLSLVNGLSDHILRPRRQRLPVLAAEVSRTNDCDLWPSSGVPSSNTFEM